MKKIFKANLKKFKKEDSYKRELEILEKFKWCPQIIDFENVFEDEENYYLMMKFEVRGTL